MNRETVMRRMGLKSKKLQLNTIYPVRKTSLTVDLIALVGEINIKDQKDLKIVSSLLRFFIITQ